VGDGTLKDKFPRLYEALDTKIFWSMTLLSGLATGPHKSTFGRYRGGGNYLIGKKTWKKNFWKSSTLLFGMMIHLIGGVGWMRKLRLTLSNLVIGP